MEFELFLKLKNAYGESTHNNNFFERLLNNIEWDEKFYADGENYFIKGNMIFTTPSFDPFNMDWKPSAIFKDGSYLEF